MNLLEVEDPVFVGIRGRATFQKKGVSTERYLKGITGVDVLGGLSMMLLF